MPTDALVEHVLNMACLTVLGIGALCIVANRELAAALILLAAACEFFAHVLPFGGLMNVSIFAVIVLWVWILMRRSRRDVRTIRRRLR